MTIYLAGKVNGNKHKLRKSLNSRRKYPVDFCCSDGSNHSEHLWGFGYYEYSEPNLRAHIFFEALTQIKSSDFVLAYLDTPDSFGSIIEITYASSFSKTVYMLINEDGHNSLDHENNTTDFSASMRDAYWFASNLPNVIAVVVTDENAQGVFDAIAQLESPIEHKLMYSMMLNDMVYECTTQLEVGNYRVDFAFTAAKLAVELDGHDYHKTKEQRMVDAKRDRYLTSEGWTVMRFTGSEVHANVIGCRDEIQQALQRMRPDDLLDEMLVDVNIDPKPEWMKRKETSSE